jgi:hypothetical protein
LWERIRDRLGEVQAYTRGGAGGMSEVRNRSGQRKLCNTLEIGMVC